MGIALHDWFLVYSLWYGDHYFEDFVLFCIMFIIFSLRWKLTVALKMRFRKTINFFSVYTQEFGHV